MDALNAHQFSATSNLYEKYFSLLIPPQASDRSEGRMFRKTHRNCGKIKFHGSVKAISSNSFEARGLKFGETVQSNF